MSRNFDHGRGDELMSRVLRTPECGEEIANDLLAEFHSGYPIHNLERLLTADNEGIVATGMWIASELGAAARPLFDDIVERIHHPSPRVRFFALDCLVSCARPEDEQAVNSGLDLLEDRDQAVRWKALVFLATVPEDSLRAARDAAIRRAPKGVRAQGLELLLTAMVAREVPPVIEGLEQGDDAMLHRYAVAAAARIAYRNPSPLRRAMKSQDATIRQFAEDMAVRAGISAAPPNASR